ncbi:hypothetical protein ACFSRY_13960 [Pontibacter locisalis]|uniref:Uncharacterized protein n=1 Tax=Pontibacter locisalis TaxID=1719035 RepID=A0ABW5INE8_9BACT
MNSIDLSSYYRLYAFSDYRSMKAALPYMRRVVLAKGLTEVEEADVRRYLQRVEGSGYKNYLEPLSYLHERVSATNSLISALQVLYKSSGYSARYIVVERK